MNENICAISTALGAGAISIIRASGPDVISLISPIFKGKDLNKVDSHTINYGHIVYNDEIIDEVLVSVMKSPRTFTGEDIVEINSHGGVATTNKILEILLIIGCRLAEPGEFTKKAYLNGRIDLLEAEGINDLITSETDEMRKYAINRVEGNLSKLINKERKILISLQADLEVQFDYPDEVDEPEVTKDKLLSSLNEIKNDLEELVKTSEDGSIIKNGIDVALVGKPNVGKSSVLNHLLDKNKAIVTNIAGTTRDIVEGSLTLDGIKINLIDTAGIRETTDIVEQIGVNRSKEAINSADLVIHVINNNEELDNSDLEILNSINDKKYIILINKCDLDRNVDISKLGNNIIVYGNTIDPNGLDELKNKIKELFKFNEIKSKNYNFLSNARDISLVKKSLISINQSIDSVNMDVPYEMIASDLSEAYNNLSEIVGDSTDESVIDEIFKKFCVGK